MAWVLLWLFGLAVWFDSGVLRWCFGFLGVVC